MIRLIINGATGRMGRRLSALAALEPHLFVVAELGRSDAAPAACGADVVIDFSTPAGARRAVAIASDFGCALLVGTTGLSDGIAEEMGTLARSQPVMLAPNLAPGVAVMKRLAVEAARGLHPGVDVDLIETHHRAKRDRPSGTAGAIRAAIEEVVEGALPPDRVHSVRGGGVVGEHRILFNGPEEQIEIVHRALSRDVFARGALRAAAWLVGRAAGRYSIEDMLGLPAPALPAGAETRVRGSGTSSSDRSR